MRQSRLASEEMIQDLVKATNRYTYQPPGGAAMMTEAEIRLSFPEPTEDKPFDPLDEVEQLLELLPSSEDGQLEVKWGHDDERSWPNSPNEDLEIHENFVSNDYTFWRTDEAVYVFPPHCAGDGPVIFWFSPLIDTSEPQPNGYVNQD